MHVYMYASMHVWRAYINVTKAQKLSRAESLSEAIHTTGDDPQPDSVPMSDGPNGPAVPSMAITTRWKP